MDGVRGLSKDSKTFITTKVQGDQKLKITAKESGNEQGGEVPTRDTVALTQAMAAYAGNLKPGEIVRVRMGNEEVASIVKEGPSNWDRFKKSTRDISAKMLDVSKEAIETDPSFVFRETVEMAKEPLTQAAPETIKELSLKGLYPGVRAGVLFLDIRKAWKTFKNPKSTLADKVVDVGHCITDVGGLAGAAAPLVGLAIPGAPILAAAAIVGDIIAFGYHTLMYVLNKEEAEPYDGKKGKDKKAKPANKNNLEVSAKTQKTKKSNKSSKSKKT